MQKACVAIVCALTLTGCDAFSTDTSSEDEIKVTPQVVRLSETGPSAQGTVVEVPAAYKPDQLADNDQTAVTGTGEIPYPIYPNAKQYRVGGEHGLHIVLFETDDSFAEVDAFYKRYMDSRGLSRIVAMSDYVRYAAGEDDNDAWATSNPGIVIHGFNTAQEARDNGANAGAQTNIIVSF